MVPLAAHRTGLIANGGDAGRCCAESSPGRAEGTRNLSIKPKEIVSSSEMAARVLRQMRPSGGFLLRVEGTSMSPSIPPGSVVRVEPSADVPRVGDVLVRLVGSDIVAHRVVRVRACEWPGSWSALTKGDNALGFDAVCQADEIIGVVREVWRNGDRGIIRAREFPSSVKLWIARVSYLGGLLGARFNPRISRTGEEGTTRSFLWAVSSLLHRVVTKTIRVLGGKCWLNGPFPAPKSVRRLDH